MDNFEENNLGYKGKILPKYHKFQENIGENGLSRH